MASIAVAAKANANSKDMPEVVYIRAFSRRYEKGKDQNLILNIFNTSGSGSHSTPVTSFTPSIEGSFYGITESADLSAGIYLDFTCVVAFTGIKDDKDNHKLTILSPIYIPIPKIITKKIFGMTAMCSTLTEAFIYYLYDESRLPDKPKIKECKLESRKSVDQPEQRYVPGGDKIKVSNKSNLAAYIAGLRRFVVYQGIDGSLSQVNVLDGSVTNLPPIASKVATNTPLAAVYVGGTKRTYIFFLSENDELMQVIFDGDKWLAAEGVEGMSGYVERTCQIAAVWLGSANHIYYVKKDDKSGMVQDVVSKHM